MGKIVKIDEKGNVSFPFDYSARLQKIVKKMDAAMLDEFRYQLEQVQKFNAECLPKYRKELPKLNVMLVSSTLNLSMRDVVPASVKDCSTLEPCEVQSAFNCFMELMNYINQLVVLVPDKTLFAAFMGITTTTYDAVRQDDKFKDVFDGVDDYIQHQTLLGAKTGYTKESSSITQLHIKDGIGHSLTNARDVPTIPEDLPEFDYQAFLERRKLATAMIKIESKSTKQTKKL